MSGVRSHALRAGVAALLIAGASGVSCRGPEAAAETALDSASWTLAHQPRWRFGDGSGPPEYVLDRVFSGLITRQGAALIGNSGTQQVRMFDSAGSYVSATGRQGGGPGEFRSISWMTRFQDDSILAFDLRSQRFSVLTERGAFVRSFQNAAPGGPSFPLGIFSDGSVLVGVEKAYDPRSQAGRVRDTLALYRLAGDSAVAVRRIPGADWLLYGDGMRYRSIRLPFGRTSFVAVTGDRIVLASSDVARLHVLDDHGREIEIIDLPLRARRLASDELSEAIDEAAPDPGERGPLRREMRRVGRITAPVLTDLLVDSEMNLWVRTDPGRAGTSVKWLVVSPAGELVGSLLLPVDWRPLDIRGDRMLVWERDADEVERVSLRRVVK